MATRRLTKVVVFDQSLYRGRGDVNVWCTKINNRFYAEAVKAAPERSGELIAGFRHDTKQVGPRQVQGTFASLAPHTMYVLRGTTGPIYSNRGWRQRATTPGGYVALWKFNPKTKRREQMPQRVKGWIKLRTLSETRNNIDYAWSVSGQESQNFLLTAWRRTSYDHRALRGRRIPSFITDP